MNKVTQDRIIGIDVSRDWLDIHCLSDGQRLRLPNTDKGHARLVDLARTMDALVCFEATGGQEWRLWSALEGAGVATRQLPPAQIKAFAASRGTRAKPTGSMQNSSRGSWRSGPMRGAACHRKRYVLSEP